jgi:hypothetical protein
LSLRSGSAGKEPQILNFKGEGELGREEVFERLKKIDERLSLVEQGAWLNGEGLNHPPIEMILTLPEADIGGLHFNRQEVCAVFEKGADGWYYSRDVLFLSARNVENDNSQDILTEYLESEAVKDCFIYALSSAGIGGYARGDLEISLPVEVEVKKRYNGVPCWYWLKDKYPNYSASFRDVNLGGYARDYPASGVGGCALRFRVKGAGV